jgi:hypothetical protein
MPIYGYANKSRINQINRLTSDKSELKDTNDANEYANDADYANK